MQPDGERAAAREASRDADQDWFGRLKPHGALFAVDASQRVTRWGRTCAPLLGDADQAVGRRCYEVLASLDPRNGSRCRPNCAVMVAARRGQPLPDFDVWLPGGCGDRAAQVSVLLSVGDDGETEVLHLVRESSHRPGRDERAASSADGMRVMLGVLAGAPDAVDAPPDAPATLTDRHRQVLAALAVGESVEDIAGRLGLSTITVRNHVQSAMERLGVHSRLDAVLTAVAQGLL